MKAGIVLVIVDYRLCTDVGSRASKVVWCNLSDQMWTCKWQFESIRYNVLWNDLRWQDYGSKWFGLIWCDRFDLTNCLLEERLSDVHHIVFMFIHRQGDLKIVDRPSAVTLSAGWAGVVRTRTCWKIRYDMISPETHESLGSSEHQNPKLPISFRWFREWHANFGCLWNGGPWNGEHNRCVLREVMDWLDMEYMNSNKYMICVYLQ